jgi:hypothetical protein
MNIRRSIIGAVLAGASLVGVAAMSSAVHAAEASPPLDGWEASLTDASTASTRTAASTRRFWIENLSNTSVYVADVWGVRDADAEKVRHGEWPLDRTESRPEALLPDDSVPGRGTVVGPGEHITIEVESHFAPHNIAVVLRDNYVGRAEILLTVDLNMRYSMGWSGGFQVDAGGQNITIRDR